MPPSAGSVLPPPGQGAPGPGAATAGTPPTDGDGKSGAILKAIRDIVQATRVISQLSPAAVQHCRRINSEVEGLQKAVAGSQPPPEPAAPPM